MTINELENLAKAAIENPGDESADYYNPSLAELRFGNAANPQKILAMIELLREMGEALENLEQVKGRHHTEQAYNKCMDALAKYREVRK
jgi:hypothetical protein